MDEWIKYVEAMNGDEVSAIVSVATHLRHGIYEQYGVDLLNPAAEDIIHPNFIFEMHGLIKQFQSRKAGSDAAGLAVWLFTWRALTVLEHRSMGRRLWRELRRGFPYVEETADNLFLLTGKRLNIEGYDDILAGLEPELV